MQWDASPFAGFSTHEPWLPLTPDHVARNVATMSEDGASILVLVRSLLHYRREHAALSAGNWRALSRDGDVLAYERGGDEDQIIVVLNFTASPQAWSAPTARNLKIAISTHGDRRGESFEAEVSLRGNEGLLVEFGIGSQAPKLGLGLAAMQFDNREHSKAPKACRIHSSRAIQ